MNLAYGNLLLIVSVILLISWLLSMLGFWRYDNLIMISALYLPISCACALLSFYCGRHGGGGRAVKNLIILILLVGAMLYGLLCSGVAFPLLFLPVVFSCGYYSPKFTLLSSGITAVFMFGASLLKTFAKPLMFQNADVRYISLPVGTTITFDQPGLWSVFNHYDYDKLLYLKTEIMNELIPAYFCLIALTAICYILALRGKNAIIQQHEEAAQRARLEVALTRSRMQSMVSQMQPHFTFNVLNSIYELCEEDPKAAQQAIDEFSSYLRMNIDTLGSVSMIPFTRELEHIRTYLHLEQLRFGSRIRAEYRIQAESFEVPPLSLQPLVENAVKHGICRRREGGTVTLETENTPEGILITVSDDGVGFDTAASALDEKIHVGMKNSFERLREICGAEITFNSTPGVGTVIRILIPNPAPAK